LPTLSHAIPVVAVTELFPARTFTEIGRLLLIEVDEPV
jgi:hypothetical protein